MIRISQNKINQITDQIEDKLQRFKTINKETDGLKVYNTQLRKQIASQEQEMLDLNNAIDEVSVVERQITPLMLNMIEGLEQFVELDVPLYPTEREKRMQMLRDNQDRADISVAEKFRQVLEAYNIEANYGQSIHNYTDTLEVGGQDREVNIFAVGRVAVLYQTKDGKYAGAWDQTQRAWVELDAAKYRSAILQGIKIAKKQSAPDLITLPVPAPEVAQ